jgi:hypothetical protein
VTAEAFQYLFTDQAVVAVRGRQHTPDIQTDLDVTHAWASGSILLLLPYVACLFSAQGLLRLWLQLRSAANVGCAHPVQSTRRPSYIIAFP